MSHEKKRLYKYFPKIVLKKNKTLNRGKVITTEEKWYWWGFIAINHRHKADKAEDMRTIASPEITKKFNRPKIDKILKKINKIISNSWRIIFFCCNKMKFEKKIK